MSNVTRTSSDRGELEPVRGEPAAADADRGRQCYFLRYIPHPPEAGEIVAFDHGAAAPEQGERVVA
jgi:polyphosphate kinase 2 (PPK2 family)